MVNPLKSALLFPGQGTQFVGMGQELSWDSAELAAWLSRVERAAGLALFPLFLNGPPEALNVDRTAQIAVFAHGVGAFLQHSATADFHPPEAVAGHSMGVYAALVAAQSLSSDDALHLVIRAADLAAREFPSEGWGMAVVIGLLRNEVEALLDEQCEIACVNTARQLVISGRAASLDRAIAKALASGALRAERLPISIPYHSRFMEKVSMAFREEVEGVRIEPARIPFFNPLTHRLETDPVQIKAYLLQFLHFTQDWEGSMKRMIGLGFTAVCDMGPGEALSRMLRWIDRQVVVSQSQRNRP